MSTYVESGEEALDDWKMALRDGSVLTYLNSLNIKAMQGDDAVLLLNNLLLTMYDEQNFDDTLLEQVLNSFESLRPAFARASPMAVAIVTLPLIDLGAVSWVWLRQETDVRTVILDLSGWLANEQVGLVMKNVASIYLREDPQEIYDLLVNPSKEGSLADDLLSTRTIGFLMDQASGKGADSMWNWLRELYAENGPLVGPPPWMIKETPKEVLDPSQAYIIADPLSEETLSILTSTIPPTSVDRAISIIRCDISIVDSATKRSKYEVNDQRFENLEQEKELFRLYGPSNVFFTDAEDDELPPGSDRMFLCSLYNYDEDTEIDEPIYNGACDWRGHAISSERAAVRRPVPGGGWEGSYCSTTCIREQCEDSRGTGAIPDVDGVLSMVDTMEQQLVEWGVYEAI